MRCREIIEKLEKLAPPELACEWDNSGLLVGQRTREVKRVFLTLDATDDAIYAAEKAGADLLITHHPLIFKPLKKINDDDFIARRIMRLIRADICCYAMHTNFDAAPGCMSDLAAERLGLSDCTVLEPEGTFKGEDGDVVYGIGKIGKLPYAMGLEELGYLVKERFGLPFVTVYGAETITEPISEAAISPGSGRSMITPAVEQGMKVLITGDIGHHEGIDAAAEKLAVIDAGHYGLERIFVDFMAEFLEREMDGLQVIKSDPAFPAKVI